MLIATYPSHLRDRDAYNALPRCADGAAPDAAGCWAHSAATVRGRSVSSTALGTRVDSLVLSMPATVSSVDVASTAPYLCTNPGDPAELKFWRGQLTGVYTPYGFVPTVLNPNVGHSDQLEGGVLLLALAAVVPVVLLVGPRVGASAESAVPEATRWRRLIETPAVRVGIVAFGLGQLADVLTSALGQRAGLLEGNPLVADIIRVMGPLGFLVFRLPLIALALIGMARLPRLVVVGILVGAGLYFSAVGAHNLQLALAAGPPADCGPLQPLP